MTYVFDPILGGGRDDKVTLPAMQTAFDAGTAPQKAAFQSVVSGYQPHQVTLDRPARIFCFGNSIGAQGITTGVTPSGWTTVDEMVWPCATGLVRRAKFTDALTAGYTSTYPSNVGDTDMYGTYGWPGATLAQIITDITRLTPNPQLLQLAQAERPDAVLGVALIENDIGLAPGATFAEVQARIKQFCEIVSAWWPGVNIYINSPRPSFTYTADMRTVWRQVTNWMRTVGAAYGAEFCMLDTGYPDPLDASMPMRDQFTGSIAGGVLTVTAAPVYPLGVGSIVGVFGAAGSARITAAGTGTGGAGTYTVALINGQGDVASGQLNHYAFTDTAVHPNGLGASRNGHLMRRFFEGRIRTTGALPILQGPNPRLTGSVTANNFSGSAMGTLPTGVAHIAQSDTSVSIATAALGYGFDLTITTTAATTARHHTGNIELFNVAGIPAGLKRARLRLTVQVVSGGEHIQIPQVTLRGYGPTTNLNPVAYVQALGASDTPMAGAWVNGETYLLETGEAISPDGIATDFTRLTAYLRVVLVPGAAGRSVVLRVLGAGYQ